MTLVELNSDNYPVSTVTQTQSQVFNCQGLEFDFENHMYYEDAFVQRSGRQQT
jgi:hypothetical protein